MIPIGTNYRMTRRPWVNYALVAANVILFVLGCNGMTRNIGRIEAYLLHPQAPLLHQFFSSVFLHGSWGHLIGNMIFLWVFGNAINDRFGHLGYLAFYLAGGILACVGYVLLAGNAPVLGASGAISAVTGAYLVLLPRVRVTLLAFFLYVLVPIEISSLLFLMFQFIWNMWMSLDATITGQGAGGVAYAAHSTGYVFGILVSIALLALRLLPRDAYDLLNLIRSWRRREKYRWMVAQGYSPFEPTAVQQELPEDTKRYISARTVEAATADTESSRELQLRRDIADACRRQDLAAAASLYLSLVQVAEGAVLPQACQLDVANQLMATEQYAAAADAYERLLKHYSDYEHKADIHLMLGLIYGRYLHQYERAEETLQLAIRDLKDPRKLQLAKGDLQALRRRGGS
jgi:membrane associated rhomboid family serine protease